MKQAADKFTKDAFDAPRRGRPPVAHPKTSAERQAAFRARRLLLKQSQDAASLAQYQLAEIEQMLNKLRSFRDQWPGLDERIESRFVPVSRVLVDLTVALRFCVTRNENSQGDMS